MFTAYLLCSGSVVGTCKDLDRATVDAAIREAFTVVGSSPDDGGTSGTYLIVPLPKAKKARR